MTQSPVLFVENLSVAFGTRANHSAVVHGVSLELYKGKTLALVGESGSGKSVTAMSILKLLPTTSTHYPSGTIHYKDHNLLKQSDKNLQAIRGQNISMIFQEPMMALNPLHTIGRQLKESISLHQKHTNISTRIAELLDAVEMPEFKERLNAYPHELSGGQRQRIMIAMAIANEPDILIADEPTTALDVTVQKKIMELLQKLQAKMGMSFLLITHDLSLVRHVAHQVAVMQHGRIVETGDAKTVFSKPTHNYTKHLLASIPSGRADEPLQNGTIMLSAQDLTVGYTQKKGFLGLKQAFHPIVRDAALSLKQGETLGIVGESGSGKTTLAMALLQLMESKGTILYEGKPMPKAQSHAMRNLRCELQIVFQDPFSSLNPRLTVGQLISEGVKAHHAIEETELNAIIEDALRDVGLKPDMQHRYPHHFSGGQRQRIAIARALALKPKVIIFDEPTSALDVSTQSQILSLLKELQTKRKLAYIFISHDLRVVRAIAHQMLVLQNGTIVEHGKTASIFDAPAQKYTKKLIKSSYL